MDKKKEKKAPRQDDRPPSTGLRGLIGAARAGKAEVPQSERRSYEPTIGPEDEDEDD